ncbi:hypothetical protein FGU71_00040 [Erythrobacter insulae]|uniref:Uncharacterized protein n=1 Tax=Erythrobacter insulae TaxID=2584124 RepID=A0A547P8G4_9SPHN|nr:hypothetical protein [Erythrobacter insulae]TRD10418.1 hypothetical protein FGU71_00040 [Erythrobacter insulae]
MSGASYNGYSWKQRDLILKAYHRGEAGPDFTLEGKPCGLCRDPDRAPGEWHSEDYSQPFRFEPPQTSPICKSCHLRLHKRFNQPPEEWELFCRHVDAGGYGRDFVATYPLARRRALMHKIANGEAVEVPLIRERELGDRWWRNLTLDPESLEAPWARPRPLRPRPDKDALRRALCAISPSQKEWAILRFHAHAFRRTATMRVIAAEVLGSSSAQTANLAYGKLARRLVEMTGWEPDVRPDASPIWMRIVAEGWAPPSKDGAEREYELVMVPDLVEVVRSLQ